MNDIKITADDLLNMVKLIDIVTQRGAFRASELSEVGKVHDMLVNVLSALEQQQKEDNDTVSKEG